MGALVVAGALCFPRCDCTGELLVGDAGENRAVEEPPPPPLTWSMTIGSLYDKEEAIFVLVTAEGYIVAGERDWAQGGDAAAWIAAIDPYGNISWSTIFDTVYEDHFDSIQPSGDGGFILGGRTRAHPRIPSAWVLRLAADGTVQWQKDSIQNDLSRVRRTYSVVPASSGHFMAMGDYDYIDESANELVFFVLDEAGSVSRSMAYGVHDLDLFGLSLAATGDGGYVICGREGPPDTSYSLFLIRLDSEINTLWHKVYTGISVLWGHSIQETSDGGLILHGSGGPVGEEQDPRVLKLDGGGSVAWQESFHSSVSAVTVSSLEQTSDGGFILAGFLGEWSDLLILKIDAAGSIVWQKAYGGPEPDWASDAHQAADGGYIIVGGSRSFGDGRDETWILKLDEDGNLGADCTAVMQLDPAVFTEPTHAAPADISSPSSALDIPLAISDSRVDFGTYAKIVETQCAN